MGRTMSVVLASVTVMVLTSSPTSAQSATDCVPPEVDISIYTSEGQIDFDAYVAAVAAANAICDGSNAGGVVITPDSVPAVSNTVGSAGGSLEVTSSSGVQFSFTVPPGSLEKNVVITVSPVNMSVGGAAAYAALQFSPEGLTFDPPAIITMNFPLAVPDPLYLYQYTGIGTNFTLLSYTITSPTTITASIPHFSGVAAFTSPVLTGSLPTTGSSTADLLPYGVVIAGLGVMALGAARTRRPRRLA